MDKRIALSNPIALHEGEAPIDAITLREPTGADLFDLGEPTQISRAPDGTFYEVEFVGVIKQYAARLIKHEAGDHLLKMLSLEDGKKLKAAILGFFTAADQAIIKKSATSSSSI
jgi:hypothetical protein